MQTKYLTVFSIMLMYAATMIEPACGQTGATNKLYQQMAPSEQAAFVGERVRAIARQMSATEYDFTPAFEMEVQKFIDSYVRRIGNNRGDSPGKGDARFIFERGQRVAPTVIPVFKANNISPLMGLYIPLVESEYRNESSPNSVGAIGMFQFLPKTGQLYGLSTADLLDVEKSADAAARYLSDGLNKFRNDPMKEALALLAYNRGASRTAADLVLVITDENKQCSICALTAARGKLDENFQNENVNYVPRFFAAAIIGENPQSFGLKMQPLLSYEVRR
ncbi:MAG: transglycosylase SLT domain-containing protein [bacterium]